MTRDEGMELVHELPEKQEPREALSRRGSVYAGVGAALLRGRRPMGAGGLMHDADYEATEKDPVQHTLLMAKLLEERKCDPRVIHAVRAHSDEHGVPRESLMDKALYACDTSPA